MLKQFNLEDVPVEFSFEPLLRELIRELKKLNKNLKSIRPVDKTNKTA